MTKIQKTISFFLLFSTFYFLFSSFAQSKTVDLYFFYGQGCPYCAQMTQNLIGIQKDYPDLKMIPLEVWYSPLNVKLLNTLADAYKVKITGVPVIFIGDTVTQGIEPEKVFQIKEAIRICSISDCSSPLEKIKIASDKPTLNFKNIGLVVGGLVIFLILILSLKKKKPDSNLMN